MIFFVFGGETYYADCGARDLIFRTHDKQLAVSTARNLIGKKIIIVEDYDIEEEYCIDYTIEWTQVMDEECTVIEEFGKPYGKKGHIEMNGLDYIKLIR